MKQKKASVYCLIGSLFLVFSCSQPKEEVEVTPNFLIPEDSFKMVMYDLHLLEGFISRNPEKVKSTDTLYEKQSMALFEKYLISEERFKKSFDYYLAKPEEMDKMYDEILEELTKNQADLSKKVKQDTSRVKPEEN